MALRRLILSRNRRQINEMFSFNNKHPYHNSKIMNLISNDFSTAPMLFSNGSSNERQNDKENTLSNLKINLAKEMGVYHSFNHPSLSNREKYAEYLPNSQEQLPKRSMQDSYIAAIIPLSNNLALQEKYTTFLGSVRLGRLLEDMDIFAVIVARKHILNPKLPKDALFPVTLVTVLVDRIDFTDYLPKPDFDIKISGHVSWVGKTTLEVVVWLEQENKNGKLERITRALFLMAARDPTNKFSTVVNPMQPDNERERTILSGGEIRKQNRLRVDTTHVSKVIPDTEEQKIIHDIYTKLTTIKDNETDISKKVLPTDSVWMSNCKISNVMLAHPEHRNLHSTVFGGFIMRQATELSWILGYKFSKIRPRTKHVSNVSFKQPIAVNSLIQMHAQVVFTYENYIQNFVFAEVYDPVTGKTAATNSFHFTLEVPDVVPQVIPLTYHEAMLYIDGRRHFFASIKNENLAGDFKCKL